MLGVAILGESETVELMASLPEQVTHRLSPRACESRGYERTVRPPGADEETMG